MCICMVCSYACGGMALKEQSALSSVLVDLTSPLLLPLEAWQWGIQTFKQQTSPVLAPLISESKAEPGTCMVTHMLTCVTPYPLARAASCAQE